MNKTLSLIFLSILALLVYIFLEIFSYNKAFKNTFNYFLEYRVPNSMARIDGPLTHNELNSLNNKRLETSTKFRKGKFLGLVYLRYKISYGESLERLCALEILYETNTDKARETIKTARNNDDLVVKKWALNYLEGIKN